MAERRSAPANVETHDGDPGAIERLDLLVQVRPMPEGRHERGDRPAKCRRGEGAPVARGIDHRADALPRCEVGGIPDVDGETHAVTHGDVARLVAVLPRWNPATALTGA